MKNDFNKQKIKQLILDKFGYCPEPDPFGPLACFDENLTIEEILEIQKEIIKHKIPIGLKTLAIPKMIKFLALTKKLNKILSFIYSNTWLFILLFSIGFFFIEWYLGLILLFFSFKELFFPFVLPIIKKRIRTLIVEDYEVYYVFLCSGFIKIKYDSK